MLPAETGGRYDHIGRLYDRCCPTGVVTACELPPWNLAGKPGLGSAGWSKPDEVSARELRSAVSGRRGR